MLIFLESASIGADIRVLDLLIGRQRWRGSQLISDTWRSGSPVSLNAISNTCVLPSIGYRPFALPPTEFA